MFFAKTLVALAFAATALASPMKRVEGGNSTCFFIMTPKPELSPGDLQISIDFAIGEVIGHQFPNELFNDTNTLFRHDDGTFDVTSIISVEGEEPATVGAFVDTLAGKTIQGFDNVWAVGAADCFQ